MRAMPVRPKSSAMILAACGPRSEWVSNHALAAIYRRRSVELCTETAAHDPRGWSLRAREEPTRLECLRRLVAADEPQIHPIARGTR